MFSRRSGVQRMSETFGGLLGSKDEVNMRLCGSALLWWWKVNKIFRARFYGDGLGTKN